MPAAGAAECCHAGASTCSTPRAMLGAAVAAALIAAGLALGTPRSPPGLPPPAPPAAGREGGEKAGAAEAPGGPPPAAARGRAPLAAAAGGGPCRPAAGSRPDEGALQAAAITTAFGLRHTDARAFAAACRQGYSDWEAAHRCATRNGSLVPVRGPTGGAAAPVCREPEGLPKPLVGLDCAALRVRADPAAAAAAAEARRIWIDLGANVFARKRQARGSDPGADVTVRLGSTAAFACGYPGGDKFELWAFEANPEIPAALEQRLGSAPAARKLLAFTHTKRRGKNIGGKPKYSVMSFPPAVRFVRAAAGTSNGTTSFWVGTGGYSLTSSMERTAKQGWEPAGEKVRISVTLVDFAQWLQEHVRPADFCVLKMDIEGGEHSLIPRMLEQKAFALVDEFFFECHPQSGSGADCAELQRLLRGDGVLVHDWF
eukprot:TRINITY_DN10228_c1_g1_i1.p1 TRINITY_DN10228_c1_g1~~TRINITY_DN10228_c1_g1_i1.p1  ORF type:complete len:459 (+),score=108.22 TRINITY_DN10228_c1_g1_i1:92-1378(+)